MKKNNLKVIDTKNYKTFLKQIKDQIQTSQVRAIGAVKSEMTILYFNVGKAITQKQKEEGWGAMVIKKLSLDLQNELPKVKGFSERNIKFMHQFYNEYANDVKGKLPVSLLQVSWSYNIVLTIGLILCQEKDEIVAEYSLRNMIQPIGISEYELTEVLPKEFVSSLPTIEMIESEFSKIEDKN